jgi:hypothetical protein
MVRAYLFVFTLGIILTMAGVAAAQDFPYSVPQAPEFDNNGSGSANLSGQQDRPSKRPYYPQREEEKVDYRSVRPYAPQDGQYQPPAQAPRQELASPAHRNVAPAPNNQAPSRDYGRAPVVNPEAYEPRPVRTPATARPAQPQPNERPDCTMYPMIIAQSRSEQEMQMAAKRYLGCLMENGWAMEQARMHVISTIENTYKLTR